MEIMVFDDLMTVMQVRPNYSIVYQFKPTLKLEKKHVKTQKHFITHIKELSTNWKDGSYFLKSPKGTFAYFNINGNKISLAKKSKLGKEYLCWQYFTDSNIGSKKMKTAAIKIKAK
ncbi:MAG: hypothetical protein AABW52_01625 [Nanoarchaeota archaeon]|mgnify:CR=1 FL=1